MKALFGMLLKVGVNGLPIPRNIIDEISAEEDLEQVYSCTKNCNIDIFGCSPSVESPNISQAQDTGKRLQKIVPLVVKLNLYLFRY